MTAKINFEIGKECTDEVEAKLFDWGWLNGFVWEKFKKIFFDEDDVEEISEVLFYWNLHQISDHPRI